jgi:CheY-like chemotaxis protein
MMVKELRKRIRDALFELVKEPRDVLTDTVEATREIAMITLRGGKKRRKGTSRQVAKEIVEGAIEAGSEAGANLNSVAKGAVIGAMQGVGEVTEVNGNIISTTAKAALIGTSKAGGNVVTAARSIVQGAIEASARVGFKAEDAAAAAAAGLLQAAEQIGTTAVDAVNNVISGSIFGIRIALGIQTKKPIILTLDSNQANLELLSQQLVKEGYETVNAVSLEELDVAIREKKNIELSLIDLSGFDERVWERCEALRKAKIPFIVIAPHRSPLIQKDSMKHGASGLLVKPLGIKELMEYIHTLLGE